MSGLVRHEIFVQRETVISHDVGKYVRGFLGRANVSFLAGLNE